jgi:hypothetical protein
MSVKKEIGTFFLILDVVALNAGVGYMLYKSEFLISKSQLSSNNQVPITQTIDQCGEACRAYINKRVEELTLRQVQGGSPAGPSATPKVIYVPQTASGKNRITSYVITPGSGSTSGNDWTDLAGTEFYFNPADYPGMVEVYYEVNMKLFNGNGMAYVRLYDATHGVGVQGSDVQTNSQTDGLVVSGRVSFWSGKNLIKVQAKSLTADTAVFTSGRLRIVTEN